MSDLGELEHRVDKLMVHYGLEQPATPPDNTTAVLLIALVAVGLALAYAWAHCIG